MRHIAAWKVLSIIGGLVMYKYLQNFTQLWKHFLLPTTSLGHNTRSTRPNRGVVLYLHCITTWVCYEMTHGIRWFLIKFSFINHYSARYSAHPFCNLLSFSDLITSLIQAYASLDFMLLVLQNNYFEHPLNRIKVNIGI